MNYTLKKDVYGNVNFVMETGNDLVTGKMNAEDIARLESACEAKKSKLKSYPIQLGVYHFEGNVKK